MYDKIRSQAISIFVKDGYVLDLSDRDFKNLTMSSVGESVKDKYNTTPEDKVSKGKALKQFLFDNPEKGLVLIESLLNHYEQLPKDSIYRDSKKDKQANKLRVDLSEELSNYIAPEIIMADTVKYFDDEYISEEIKSMQKSIKKSPNDAIDKAKNLVESCFKFILDEYDISYSNTDDLGDLRQEQMRM